VGVFIGLESFNEKALNGSEKSFNKPQDYKNAIGKLHAHGIFVESGVIFGFDHDDVSVFESTLRMLEEIQIDAVQVSVLTPLPGTPLNQQIKHHIFDTNLEHYDYRHVVFRPHRMRAGQLQAGTDWVIRKFYSPWRIMKRTVRWLRNPKGLSHFIYPFVLNWAYFGRTVVFGICGRNPVQRKRLFSNFLLLVLRLNKTVQRI
jgi:radical SAM superfamily enzyme YgiQ (UPF0313 family)